MSGALKAEQKEVMTLQAEQKEVVILQKPSPEP